MDKLFIIAQQKLQLINPRNPRSVLNSSPKCCVPASPTLTQAALFNADQQK